MCYTLVSAVVKTEAKFTLFALRVQANRRFTQFSGLHELSIEYWDVLYQVAAFTLTIGSTIAITMQEMVNAIIHAITIFE